MYDIVLLVEEVVALHGKGEGETRELPTVGCRQVVRVPRLFVVLTDVGTGMVALAHVDERVVKSEIPPRQVSRHATAMPGDVCYLASVCAIVGIVVRRVGTVGGRLVGVVQAEHQRPVPAPTHNRLCRCLHAGNVHLAHVHHHPAVLARALGNGNYLVVHTVEIAVGLHLHMAEQATVPVVRVDEAKVPLTGRLGLERGIANLGIVEVVERGQAEDAFIESTEREVGAVLQRLIRHVHGRCPSAGGTGNGVGRDALGGTVPHIGTKERSHQAQTAVFVLRGKSKQECVAHGKDEVGERGIQRVVLIVGGQVHLPTGEQFHMVCRAEV